MPVLDSYLFFSGRCAEAMRFYERTLGGKLDALMTYADSPDPQHCPAGAGDLVMASDTPPGMPSPPMGGFSLSLQYPGAQEARRIFDALSQGGEVRMPMQETFWAEAFGMLVDRFGTPWMVGGGMRTTG